MRQPQATELSNISEMSEPRVNMEDSKAPQTTETQDTELRNTEGSKM